MANVFSDYAFLHNNLNLNRLDLGAYLEVKVMMLILN